MQNLAACLWILSKVLICFRQCGSHDADAYSSIGRTSVVLAIDLMWVGHLFRFLLLTPNVCRAFLATELHCAVQFKVFDICTPC